MIDVLFISSKNSPISAVADAVRKLEDAGAGVSFAGSVSESWLGDLTDKVEFAHTHQLPRANKRRAVDLPYGEQVWLRCKTDRWLRTRARTAHVLVALDDGAVYTVWQLAQRNRTAKAVFGFAPALNAVRDINEQGGPARPGPFRRPVSLALSDFGRAFKRIPDATERLLTPRPVMRRSLGARLWRLPLRAPGVPEALRVRIGRRVAEAMYWAGKPSGGAYALALTASKISDTAVKAELLEKAATKEFKRGVDPEFTSRAVQALLANGDRLLGEGKYEEAALALNRALVLGFHRVSHIDQLSSPLAADAKGYAEQFHRSPAMKTIMTPRGRLRPPAPAPADRPLRLLVTTSQNDNFLFHILDRYRNHPEVEVRYLDMAAQQSLRKATGSDWRVLQERLGGDPEYADTVEALMRPHLDWADVVFLDWCVGPAAMLTTIDPGDTRIIVRLHSYEAFTRWPQVVDFSRIDDLVFVAEHVRDLVTEQVPQLRGPLAPRTHVLHNAMPLSDFDREKTPDARYNIGLVGISQVAKDPLWAVEVLRLLRAEDERYRLLLVGGDMDPRTSRATRKYLNNFMKEIEPLVKSGAVLRLGPTDDVAGRLTEIGFILSSSVREGCHVGLMEGAASGAVPVVRDWPFYAGKVHSARTLYPKGWVLDTPEEAVRRILEVNATEEAWRDHAKLASEYALSTWDWSVVSADFDELFFGERR
ncbi:glycosyltransferase family protein [Glycomyces albidus]|uniref:Glycosyltransferase family 1 protein n=1 Tax=Glycomyces albidus TaxID=2656774 RepID=A0A6L5GGE3_9ACTN|nr:hypothetical protein [Glycomyces albidus]MQM28433.1 glycosyltransferase family 1 protein [Glycomyces albidus]